MLTKSLFKLAIECPTKVYYATNNYHSSNVDDDFLKALAQGGFQVGELARCYYPEGILISESSINNQILKTQELLRNESVTIFEATFKYQNYLAKIDILTKQGSNIKIIEVKSKSVDDNETFLTKRGKIASEWKKYLYDVAFQKYVVSQSLSEGSTIKSYLFLLNKDTISSVEGLNQKFKIINTYAGETKVQRNGDCSLSALGDSIMKLIDVTSIVENVIEEESNEDFLNMTFVDFISFVAEKLSSNERVSHQLAKRCKICEFKSDTNLSGFAECWQNVFRDHPRENEINLIYNIWRYTKTNTNFQNQIYFMSQLDLNEFDSVSGTATKLNPENRQLIQIKSLLENSPEEILMRDGLKSEFVSWTYPFHLIDFETSRVALPFRKNKRPYQIIAFQFSHHVINVDWTIEHKGEFLNADQGTYPNYDFLRELRNQLNKDTGTIFMYHHYERDVLNELKEEFKNVSEHVLKDKQLLIDWIDNLTNANGRMVDLLDILKKYYYNPLMKGSNSIKVVLPAILNSSSELRVKYSEPIYGTAQMISKNFSNKRWIEVDNKGIVKDPYDLLEKFKYDLTEEDEERILTSEGITNGGSAMIAYNQLQYTHISDNERQQLKKALLQYCELDTFAMVLLLEFWKHRIEL